MSLNTIIADELRERAVFLARYDATMRNKMVALLKQLERDVTRRMMDLDEFGELTAAGRARMEAIITWTRSTIANAYKGIHQASVEQLVNLARNEVAFIEKTMNKGVGVQLLDTSVTPAGLAEIVSNTMVRGNPMEEWWAGQAVDLGRKFAAEMRIGMAAGETLSQLVQRVRGTSANGFSDGIMQTATRNAAALVRTAVQSVSNNTRMKVYKENEDVIGSLQHVSTLDDRTTDVCKARDGLRWKLNGEPIGHDMKFDQPPLHWNCRSTLIPVTKTWAEMGFDVDELTPGQRASMDGAVPADMTYEQWLKGKGEEFQNRVLGQEKAQMWRDGEITFRDLVDQTGRPLTLEELQDKVTERDLVDTDAMFEGSGSAVEESSSDIIVDPQTRELRNMGPSRAELLQSHRTLPTYVDEMKTPALEHYIAEGFTDINSFLNSGMDAEVDGTEMTLGQMADQMKRLSKPVQSDLSVYRGTAMHSGRYDNIGVGSTIDYKGFVSTSRSIDEAAQFADKSKDNGSEKTVVMLEISLPKGQRAIITNAAEAEVILPADTRLVVESVEQDVVLNRRSSYGGPLTINKFIRARVEDRGI